jgi:hypothetical protein
MKGNTGKEIWDEVNKSISNFNIVYPILDRAYNLLGQATTTFGVQAYEAVAILCRACIEAAFLDFLTLKWKSKAIKYLEPKTLGGDHRRVDYSELEEAMKKQAFLSDKWHSVKRIREHGNFTSHIAEIQPRAYGDLFVEMTKIELRIKAQGGTVEDIARAYSDLGKRHMISIGKERALEDLRDTASILVTIAHAIRRPRKTK